MNTSGQGESDSDSSRGSQENVRKKKKCPTMKLMQ